jgi:hypothetical protein
LNWLAPVAFARTVDLTDLVALPMIPLAVWAGPRLEPWPLPRTLQIGLAVLAPLAFAATSQPRGIVRSTLDVSSVAAIDEAALLAYLDEVAEEHGLRCAVCDSLAEGRVYSSSSGTAPDDLTVSFDAQRRHLFYTTTAYGRRAHAAVVRLSEDIQAGLEERYSGVMVIEFADNFAALPEASALFTVRLPDEGELTVEKAEQAKRTFSTIVEEIVRAHGLRADEDQLVYYTGRRFGASSYDREFILVPFSVNNTMMRVRVARQTPSYAALHETIKRELAARLAAEFGSAAVAREDFEAD